ncbi:MAG: mechanosensitive ion channel family protein [Pseudomonadota bacterium]|nr:mechanosensitive ion channel family protein [Pseudomonadota bacterium]
MNLLEILLERVQEMIAGFMRTLPQLAIGLAVLLITWGVTHLIRSAVARLTARTRLRPSLRALFVTLAGILVWLFGILVALAVVLPGVNAGSLIAILGFGSVAIGFAFRDIFENFLAGVLIMLRRKMRIGDVIECEGVEGRVEQTTLRETYLRRLDNELTIVPNSFLFKNPVRILTDARVRRYELTVGVAYDTDLDGLSELIAEAVAPLDGVEKGRPVEVYAAEFGDSSINFTIRWWAGSRPLDMHQSRDHVVRAIKRALDDRGIEIPFPQRVHWFPEPLQFARKGQK